MLKWVGIINRVLNEWPPLSYKLNFKVAELDVFRPDSSLIGAGKVVLRKYVIFIYVVLYVRGINLPIICLYFCYIINNIIFAALSIKTIVKATTIREIIYVNVKCVSIAYTV